MGMIASSLEQNKLEELKIKEEILEETEVFGLQLVNLNYSLLNEFVSLLLIYKVLSKCE